MTTGAEPILPSGGDTAGPYTGTTAVNPFRNRLYVDGAERRYYTWNPQNGDLCMSLTDLQLMLDLTIVRETADTLSVAVGVPFRPDLGDLKNTGFFDCINAIYLADTATDEILFRQNSITAVPIASLSKLLSYLVLLALAEHLCGSEEAFVVRMNSRAQELGLKSTRMYNCSGLPSFSEDSIPVKRQNRMSAEDLYRLVKIIMERYPDITEITSIPLAHMPSLNDYRTANSNPLLFNMSGVTGLKTGSTNKAGYCVAATLPVQKEGETHTLVLILLGAETADLRGQAAEILLRDALSHY